MPSFEDDFIAACESGEFEYVKAMGVRSTKSGSREKPLELDTILSIASCTKLMTAVAALQCVEAGLLSLEDDVYTTLPELNSLDIITGFEEATGKPIMKPRSCAINIKHLLTHCSGLCYDIANPLLQKWRASRGEAVWSGSTIEERFCYPLLFEPGTGWTYGSGTDWVGKMIERVTGETLEVYMSKHIWTPLGMLDTTFWPSLRENMHDRMADMSMRDPYGSGKAVPLEGFDMANGLRDCSGGAGAFASAQDFMKLLQAILQEDERLLQKDSYRELYAPQLSEASREVLQNLVKDDEMDSLCGMNIPQTGERSWSLGGTISLDEYPGWMGKNTMLWGGVSNVNWFLDREKGFCGLLAPQLFPQGEATMRKLYLSFQQGIYERFASFEVGSESC